MRARFPSLYQINTRVWLHEVSVATGRPATLDDVPDASLDRIAADGFDWMWLLGVWQTGAAGRRISLSFRSSMPEYREVLPDVTEEDVRGSPFAVAEYVVHRDFGGPSALARLRARLAVRGVLLMLDFVGNHTAIDHAWVFDHPEFYVAGTEDDLAREPRNYRRVETRQGSLVLAHGRDPNFPGWADTLQVNYRHAGLRASMLDVLERIAGQCDALRCDMAMLSLPDVIARTWGDRMRPVDGRPPVDDPLWPVAISHVRQRRPEFMFLAEAYWDLEWALQQQGFDYTYDKSYYDRLRTGDAVVVHAHLRADGEYQRRSARFLENHDEPRAAAVFEAPVHRAAAMLAFLVPGLRLLHEGQESGRRIRTSIHLRRRAFEAVDQEMASFYARLVACMRRPEVRGGDWLLLDCRPAWAGNPTSDRFIAFSWESPGRRLVVAVNYGPTQGQCYVRLPWTDLAPRMVTLSDVMAPGVRYGRDGTDLERRGLYLDLAPWGHHAFEVLR